MHRLGLLPIAAVAIVCLAGCGGGNGQGASSSPSPAAAPSHTALPASTKTPVTFNFTDVAVASAGSNTLRLGFDIANGMADPLLCDASEFSLQLDDNSVVEADGSADSICTPDTVDPNSNGKAVMFFNLPPSYTGGATLILVVNDAVIGQGATSVK
jgi:hypothetical protein